MKTFKYISILFIIFIISFSCDDELNKYPLNEPTDATFYSNEDQLIMAINGVYTGLWWEARNTPFPIYLDFLTDMGFIRSDAGLDLIQLAQGGASSQTKIFTDTWGHFYRNISYANDLLYYMNRAEGNISNELYDRIRAEAQFLRAFYYFWLINLYGDVPFVTEPTLLENANIPRTPKEEIIDVLFQELESAAQLLPVSYTGKDVGRATKGAALTLKARMAFYAEDYTIAAQEAKRVMDLNKFELYPDYELLFQYEGERSPEIIFDSPYDVSLHPNQITFRQGTRNVGGYSELVPSQYLVDKYQCTDGKYINESDLYDIANPFGNRDPRLDATIIHDGSIFAGYIFYTNPDSTQTWFVEDDGSQRRVNNQDVLNPYASFTGYCFRKYLNKADFPSKKGAVNFIYMRYAEVLLTYAEAKIVEGNIDQSVLNAINLVRARAYSVDVSETDKYPAVTTTNSDELLDIVRYERQVEFAGEGFRWMDIRRWEIAEHVMQGNLIGRPKGGFETIPVPPQFDQYGHPQYGENESLYRIVETRTFNSGRDYFWAIPQKDMDINDQLIQNPNY
jgi:starch-binding outer membrane protein, SusD/RagB family